MTKPKPEYTEIPASKMNQTPGQILERAFRGELIMLTRYGRPYVLLCPPPEFAASQAPAEPSPK